ncbi:MAG: hypothetical protein RSC10_06665 [Longicatena sp.]
MNIMNIMSYIAAALFIIEGLINALGIFVPFQKKEFSKYTDESVKAYLRPSGVINILIGIGIICYSTKGIGNISGETMETIGTAFMLICLLAGLYCWKKLLIKK